MTTSTGLHRCSRRPPQCCKVTGKKFKDLNIVICGAGAAGFAITRLLKCIGYDPAVCTR